MKDRSDEKNRLWNEVLGKKRAYEKDDESSDIELTMDGSTYRGVPNDRSILKDANSALNELMGILNRQQSAENVGRDHENRAGQCGYDERSRFSAGESETGL